MQNFQNPMCHTRTKNELFKTMHNTKNCKKITKLYWTRIPYLPIIFIQLLNLYNITNAFYNFCYKFFARRFIAVCPVFPTDS